MARAAESSPAEAAAATDLLRRLFWQAFLIRAAAALVLDFTGLSARFAPDETTYASAGEWMALYWSGDVLVQPLRFSSDQPLGYFYINAVSYYLFGSAIAVKLVNAFIGAFACRYVHRLASALFGLAVARRAAYLYCFFPSLILWSALNIRDVWVIFLILLISWGSYQLVHGYTHRGLVIVLGAILTLTTFRDYLFHVVAFPPLVTFLIGRRGHLGRNFVVALALALGLLLFVQHGVADKAHHRMSLEALSKARQDLTSGAASAFYEDVDISTPDKALAFLPLGLAYFLFSPFPWQITSFLKAFSLPEMLLFYSLVPAMLTGIRYAVTQRLRESLQMLLLMGLLTISYALGEGNVGTLYRHRAQVVSFYLIVAAVGLELRARRYEPVRMPLSA
jgi:4-amino-4-deoxy-L-arabinose transferase-like glycosyltransferase